MTNETMFESATRSNGDFAGVFEYDGETGYFYLYDVRSDIGRKIVNAMRIVSCNLDFDEDDIAVRWDSTESRVGLFIREHLCAAFDVKIRATYGGEYRSDGQTNVPPDIVRAFQ